MSYDIGNWIGCLTIFVGLWLIGKKIRTAFIFTFVGEVLVFIWAFHQRAWPICFVGVTFGFMAVRNWFKWGK